MGSNETCETIEDLALQFGEMTLNKDLMGQPVFQEANGTIPGTTT